jgi:hypothetical protein
MSVQKASTQTARLASFMKNRTMTRYMADKIAPWMMARLIVGFLGPVLLTLWVWRTARRISFLANGPPSGDTACRGPPLAFDTLSSRVRVVQV